MRAGSWSPATIAAMNGWKLLIHTHSKRLVKHFETRKLRGGVKHLKKRMPRDIREKLQNGIHPAHPFEPRDKSAFEMQELEQYH